MKRPHVGAGGIFVFVLLVLAMVFIAAMFTFSNMSSSVDQRKQTAQSLANAAAALEQFAGQTGRLPCPADPTLDTGLAVPNNASVNCTNPTGTLPWATIGMRRDDAIDAWGWKISYRVYSGAGGMTQDQGASMVNCDIAPALGSAGVDANELCRSTHATLPSEFIAGKGLSVTDFGTVYNGASPSGGAAYVVISHGPSGFGAYTSSGTQNPNSPTSTEEKNNLKATGGFTLMAASAPDVAASDNNHYDDLLLYRTISDLVKRANLSARDWPDNLASLTFDASSVQAALGSSTPPTAGSSLGTSSLQFYGATVSTSSSSISFDTVGGNDGIGIASGGSTAINGSESMSVSFAKTAEKLAVTLNDFGGTTLVFGGNSFFIPESATLRFFRNGTQLAQTTISGCQNSVPTGGPLASFTVIPGVTFDQVQITPLFSSFFLSAVRSCAATDVTCLTALDNGSAPPSGNHCS